MHCPPLHVACLSGNVQIVDVLLRNGADPSARQQGASPMQRGAAPIHVAANQGHADVVRRLHESGADLDLLHDGKSALDMCDPHPSNMADASAWSRLRAYLEEQSSAGRAAVLEEEAARAAEQAAAEKRAHEEAQAQAQAAERAQAEAQVRAEAQAEAQAQAEAATSAAAAARKGQSVEQRARAAGVELPATPAGLRDRVKTGSPTSKVDAKKELRALQKSRLQKVDRAETYADAARHDGLKEKDRKRKAQF